MTQGDESTSVLASSNLEAGNTKQNSLLIFTIIQIVYLIPLVYHVDLIFFLSCDINFS